MRHVIASSQCRYVHDALGRRLKTVFTDTDGKERITYFGWDGDRHVHTEYVREDGDRDIVHTVYEPGTFTPMVRLSTTAKGKQKIKPHLMVQAGLANLPEAKGNGDAASAPMSMLQEMLTGMTELVQKQMEQNIKHMLKEGLSPLSKSILTNMGMDPEALLANTRQGLQEAKQAELTPVTIHYFHNDHLGAPLALTDQQANIVWAVKRDPWGNIEEEYNPQGLEQPIGLPGQRLDKETGLYYNRYRYYDPKIGAYINQDPIGLNGGLNLSKYSDNPLLQIDPFGLQATAPTPAASAPASAASAANNTLSLGTMETKIAANNNSGQSNNLILCMAWDESGFKTNPSSPGSSVGLLQIKGPALKDVNSHTDGAPYTKSDMKDPDKNIAAATAYLGIQINSYHAGNVAAGIGAYGEGSKYTQAVQDCEKCLNDCGKNGLTCSESSKSACLHKIHK